MRALLPEILLPGILLALLGAAPVRAYEPEPDLPQGEWLLLEGHPEEAVRWYRARYQRDPTEEWREGLAEALASWGADLLGRHERVEAKGALEEAARLSRDPERTERIRHLIAYAEGRTTGHAAMRGHAALAAGDLTRATAEYEQALRDAHDEFERNQSATLLTYGLLLRATLENDGEGLAMRAAETWPAKGGSTEDAEQFLWAARGDRRLRPRLDDALARLESEQGEEASALRTLALCLLLRVEDVPQAVRSVRRPGWREPLRVLMGVSTRLSHRRRAAGVEVDPGGRDP